MTTFKRVWRTLSLVVVVVVMVGVVVDVVRVYGGAKAYVPGCQTRSHAWTAKESGVTIGQLVVHEKNCWGTGGNLTAESAVTQSYVRSKVAQATDYRFTGTGIITEYSGPDQVNDTVTGHAQLCPGWKYVGHVCAFDERFSTSAVMHSRAWNDAHHTGRFWFQLPGPYQTGKGYHLTWTDDGAA